MKDTLVGRKAGTGPEKGGVGGARVTTIQGLQTGPASLTPTHTSR